MLIDTVVTIAYKCPSCGSFKFFNISIFKIPYGEKYSLRCKCGGSVVTIRRNKAGGYIFTAPCIGCENEHNVYVEKNDILYNRINTFYCPTSGLEHCFIGKDSTVRKRVDELERDLDKLIDMFGYDSYFKNTQVMIDSLNKIHDIAEEGNLYCECGNSDIELNLLSDKIYLKCKKCSASRIIYAISNENLKDILMRRHILIQKGIN